jgi:ADP-ribose pyrophosphatase
VTQARRYTGHQALLASDFVKLSDDLIRASYIYEDRSLIVRTPHNVEIQRDVIRHPGAVGIVAVNSQGQILLERQYRSSFDAELLEIPAGKLDASDIDPLDAAVRELREETGLVATSWTLLGIMANSPGFSDEFSWIYLATGLDQQSLALEGSEESHMTLQWVDIETCMTMLDQSEIIHSLTVYGLMRARLLQLI